MYTIDKKTGIWYGEWVKNYHKFDESLCKSIIEFLEEENCKKVIDLGCGDGSYVNLISESIECKGYDGNPDTVELTQGLGVMLYLHNRISLKPVDWVLCIEVGNHIPKEFEDIFLNNIKNICKKGVIISWAEPNQKGIGQLNRQPNNYIIEKFKNMGFSHDTKTQTRLRKSCSLRWLKFTLMVFRK